MSGASPRGTIASPDAIVRGRFLSRGFDEDCDAVVVGSGAGGSVVAATLAEAGKRVIVLEEGPYYRSSEYERFQPSESLRRMFREAGMLTALGVGQTPIIAITLGRVVGGSSVLTGGVCFRIPGEVHRHWERDLGLDELSEARFEGAYEEVEERMHVREVPASMRSLATDRFALGAERMGFAMKPLRRNTGDDCEGSGLCNFGCPAGAKRSVDRSYLPSATSRGARVISDALVSQVIVENGRAAGVSGVLLEGEKGGERRPFRVRAPIVVAACGTLHTPLLLEATGVGRASGELGRHVTLHPSVRIVARFDDPLKGWDGALQATYSDRYASEGILVVGVYTAVNVLSAGLPGVGAALRRRVEALPSCGVIGGLIHDEGGGRVRAGPSREPLLTYAMAPRDLARVRRSMTILAELSFAAGAREVFAPVFGAKPLRSMDDARKLEAMRLDARRIECLAFHPLGSARIGSDPRRGVVDQRGECFALPGLFVADGSVLPTSIGVNSQVAIMAMATRIAWDLRERKAGIGPSAQAQVAWG